MKFGRQLTNASLCKYWRFQDQILKIKMTTTSFVKALMITTLLDRVHTHPLFHVLVHHPFHVLLYLHQYLLSLSLLEQNTLQGSPTPFLLGLLWQLLGEVHALDHDHDHQSLPAPLTLYYSQSQQESQQELVGLGRPNLYISRQRTDVFAHEDTSGGTMGVLSVSKPQGIPRDCASK
jgi:hypothetical protein